VTAVVGNTARTKPHLARDGCEEVQHLTLTAVRSPPIDVIIVYGPTSDSE